MIAGPDGRARASEYRLLNPLLTGGMTGLNWGSNTQRRGGYPQARRALAQTLGPVGKVPVMTWDNTTASGSVTPSPDEAHNTGRSQPVSSPVKPQISSSPAPGPTAQGAILASNRGDAAQPETESQLAQAARATLRRLTGRADAEFRPGQLAAIIQVTQQRSRVLVVQRTGWGKSAVYFVATALLRAQGAPPTLLVSPLLALMRDQVAAAERAGVRAVTVNSANAQDWPEISARLARDEVDVLLVSPERLTNPAFAEDVLAGLLPSGGLVVVDEAHCISDWGHDFRPDYRAIGQLLAQLPPDQPVVATTATANQRVVEDVTEQLGAGTIAGEVTVIRGGLARQSLRLAVIGTGDDTKRIGWLVAHLANLPGSGIVYTLTVRAAHQIAAVLTAHGHQVAAYTGQMGTEQREPLEEALKRNEVKALIATSALGMGFDKPDLGFVVHVGAPSSPISYYQQVGRAGRGTDDAQVVLLPAPSDQRVWQYFATASMPVEAECQQVVAALTEQGALSVVALQAHTSLRKQSLELMLKVLAVDGAVRRVRGSTYEATGQPWVYDAVRYEKVARVRADEQQHMLAYENTSECRMAFLQQCLDDVSAQPCGRCDNCAGPWLSREVADDAVAAAREQLQRVGELVEPRKQWPSNMAALGVEAKGKIGSGRRCEPGRVLARLSDVHWGVRLGELLDGDGLAPDWLLDACVAVLKDWLWQDRPTAIMAMPSPAHPQLVSSVVAQLGRVGRLQVLPPMVDTRSGAPVAAEVNSAYALAGVWGRYEVPAELTGVGGALARGPVVLLVDATLTDGWSFTVAGALLRDAGAGAVLPLALAHRG